MRSLRPRQSYDGGIVSLLPGLLGSQEASMSQEVIDKRAVDFYDYIQIKIAQHSDYRRMNL